MTEDDILQRVFDDLAARGVPLPDHLVDAAATRRLPPGSQAVAERHFGAAIAARRSEALALVEALRRVTVPPPRARPVRTAAASGPTGRAAPPRRWVPPSPTLTRPGARTAQLGAGAIGAVRDEVPLSLEGMPAHAYVLLVRVTDAGEEVLLPGRAWSTVGSYEASGNAVLVTLLPPEGRQAYVLALVDPGSDLAQVDWAALAPKRWEPLAAAMRRGELPTWVFAIDVGGTGA